MTTLNWRQRFAIIDYFKPTHADICKVFGVSISEYKAARGLRAQGFFDSDPGPIDYEVYAPQFGKEVVEEKPPVETPKVKKPVSPKPKKKTTAKPGPRTRKIKDAYEAIPRDATPVEEFRKRFGVSLSVLRRHTHFDHMPEQGKVTVQKRSMKNGDTTEKVLCIWRKLPDGK